MWASELAMLAFVSNTAVFRASVMPQSSYFAGDASQLHDFVLA